MLLKSFINYVVFCCVFIAASCSDKGQPQQQGPPPAIAVTIAQVTSSQVEFYDEYPATVTALNQVDLRAQVNGFITGVFFQDGARVSKGQKLYSIDAQQYEANYQQAVANVAVQQTNVVKAQKDADRYHELDKQDAIAKQQVDYADAALDVAKKQLEASQAAVRSVQTGVKYTTIYAPFDGTIGISQVKVGSPVSAGSTVLNTVSTDSPMAVDFSIDQKEIFRFTQLESKKVTANDSTFMLAFGNDNYPYPGKISLIDRAVDQQTGTLKIRLVFPNTKNALRGGMTGRIRVLNNSTEKSLLIPSKAITEQLGEYFVYIIGDSSKVTQQKILTGKQIGTSTIVKEGVKEGDQIVVQGVQNLREGSVIKIDTASGKK